jgi:hypothetical protein
MSVSANGESQVKCLDRMSHRAVLRQASRLPSQVLLRSRRAIVCEL